MSSEEYVPRLENQALEDEKPEFWVRTGWISSDPFPDMDRLTNRQAVIDHLRKGLPPETQAIGDDDGQRPMVTREEYDRARAVLDALPPGFYIKCAICKGWYRSGSFEVGGSPYGPACERCR